MKKLSFFNKLARKPITNIFKSKIADPDSTNELKNTSLNLEEYNSKNEETLK